MEDIDRKVQKHMKIYFEEGQQVSGEIRGIMEQAAERCLDLEGFDQEEKERTEISVTFVAARRYRP